MSLVLGQDADSRSAPWPAVAGYAAAAAMVALATLAAIVFERQVQAPNLSLVFVLPVVAAAVSFGWGPSLLAAAAGVFAYNFFLIPPLYTFEVADPENVWALVLLLAVAAIASAVAAQSRRRALEAEAAAGQARTLQTLARSLVGAADRGAIAQGCVEALANLLGPAVVLLSDPRETLEPAAMAGGARLSEADLDAARWCLVSRLPTRGGAYPTSETNFDFWPVLTPQRQGAVIGVRISIDGGGRPADPDRLVEIVAGYLAVALDREAYARQLMEARVGAAGERLKTDLLAAVSHDLRTPLSTILFALQSLLKFGAAHDAAARTELLTVAEAEAARLTNLVEKLLDMSRLSEGAVAPCIAPACPAELAAAALEQAAPALRGRRIANALDPGAAALLVDPGLFESALAKVLENAGRYGPEGSTIHIRGGADGLVGWIEVEDEGPGFPGPAEPLFRRFGRGVSGDGRPPGLGLGLSIARGFLAAMNGRMEVLGREAGRGATVRLIAPLQGALLQDGAEAS